MAAYYNEFDPYAAQWLRNLIAAGHIAPGDVDERPIQEVKADEIKGYTQCHFFAGIGGWSRALRLALWPDDRPVWTGSCPCQPFSSAGKQKGKADERHLWPVWHELIRECRPPVVFGEQVASAIAHGWWDDVAADMEREGYACGAAVLPACSVGAPHKRDRIWFVGYTTEPTREWNAGSIFGAQAQECSEGQQNGHIFERSEYAGTGSGNRLMANPNQPRSQGRDSRIVQERPSECTARASNTSVSNTDSESQEWITESRSECGFWQSEPSVGRVANGIPARAHKLRAYGNAIVPQVAAEFIKVSMECLP